MFNREILYQLYIVENKSRKEMLKILNISATTFKRLMRKLGIKKSNKAIAVNRKNTCLKKYGVSSYSATPEGRLKISKSNLNKTDTEKNITLQKRKQTCIDRYGVDNIHKLDSIKEKIELTNINKYGGIGFSSTILSHKAKETLIKNLGVDNPSKSEEIKKKKINTQKNNNKFNGSSHEETIYKYLLMKFSLVERQYRSEKYPFACDFYIPELDLYIEYQGTWDHGKYDDKTKIYGPYDKNNPTHQKIIKTWLTRAKNGHPRYETAIKTWTIRDPLKRKIAKENHLNWLEFWTIKDFIKWYNTI